MNQLLNPNGRFQIFDYQNLGKVRVQVDSKGNPWFCLSDVCDILQLSTPAKVANRLNPNGVSLIHTTDAIGRNQELTFIDEGNLYQAIGRSRKPEAVPFMDWIFREVLPMIRKTGMYLDDDTLNNLKSNPTIIGNMIVDYENELTKLKKENEALLYYAQEQEGNYNELVQDYNELIDENDELQERINELEDELDY